MYVRKGSYEGERILSFTLPEGLPGVGIIWRGFAIDGNRAVAVIEWYTVVAEIEDRGDVGERLVTKWEPEDHETGAPDDSAPDDAIWSKHHHLVLRVLHDAERLLVEWLTDLGYGVEFK